jgi:L-ascorbate metabolism protein UlaG (beta-lactamase superfamily)
MKRRWYGDCAFRVDSGPAKILIDRFLSGNSSRDKVWIGCRTGEGATQGGGR